MSVLPINQIHTLDGHIDYTSEDIAILKRIPATLQNTVFPYSFSDDLVDDEDIIHCVILDTETTGLSVDNDRILELGMVKASYHKRTGKLLMLRDAVSWYEDPQQPISAFITGLTGIDNTMTDGKRFDDVAVANYLSGTDLVIAHNASFDKRFFNARFPQFNDLNWGCSLKEVDWAKRGYESKKLKCLCLESGYFFNGHRASIDAIATAFLLGLDGHILELTHNVATVEYIVRAINAPFEIKDALKQRGYRWHNGADGMAKHWYKSTRERESEEAWLQQQYSGQGLVVDEISKSLKYL